MDIEVFWSWTMIKHPEPDTLKSRQFRWVSWRLCQCWPTTPSSFWASFGRHGWWRSTSLASMGWLHGDVNSRTVCWMSHCSDNDGESKMQLFNVVQGPPNPTGLQLWVEATHCYSSYRANWQSRGWNIKICGVASFFLYFLDGEGFGRFVNGEITSMVLSHCMPLPMGNKRVLKWWTTFMAHLQICLIVVMYFGINIIQMQHPCFVCLCIQMIPLM